MFGETFAIFFIILLVGGIIFAVCGYYVGWNNVLPRSTTSGGGLLSSFSYGLSAPTIELQPLTLSMPPPSNEVSYKGSWRPTISYGLRDIVTKNGRLYISEKDNNTDVIRNGSLFFPSYDSMKFIDANGEYGNQFTIIIPNIEINAIRVAINNIEDYKINFFSLRYLNDNGVFENLYKSSSHSVVDHGDNKWLVSSFTEMITLPVGRPIIVSVMTRKMCIGYKAEINKFSDTVSNITQVVIFNPRTVIPEESVYFVVEPLLKRNNWKCLD